MMLYVCGWQAATWICALDNHFLESIQMPKTHSHTHTHSLCLFECLFFYLYFFMLFNFQRFLFVDYVTNRDWTSDHSLFFFWSWTLNYLLAWSLHTLSNGSLNFFFFWIESNERKSSKIFRTKINPKIVKNHYLNQATNQNWMN